MNTVLHLGLGRFHRGHQAVYYQKSGNWKVVASTMRSNDERDKLKAVMLRYPVLELSHESSELTWIDCIGEALSLRDDLPRLLEVFRSPETSIVTLTVTEKGYCLLPSGDLDLQNEGIKHDLANPNKPQTAIGFLALALQERKAPLTIISCDNLRENGHKLENALKKFMGNLPGNVTFPNTMVDRIVPALLPEKVAELEKQFGLHHSEIIATERFSQWVVEDKFAGPRPQWEKVEVQFVKDVRPYEEMKLRLLNASHSYLAYAGLNRGHTFVHQAIRDNELRQDVLNLMKKEVLPLLDVPQGFDVLAYVDSLINRFQNDRLPHQLKQIAMDGSQKLPQRIFSSLQANGKEQTVLRKCVNEWLEFLWNNREGKIDDPKAGELFKNISKGKEVWKKELLKEFGQ